jgi:hypothetical protein
MSSHLRQRKLRTSMSEASGLTQVRLHGAQGGQFDAAVAAAVAGHDHIGLGSHHVFGIDLWKRPHRGGQDVDHAHARERFANERGFTRAIGCWADLEIHPLPTRLRAERLHRRLHAQLDALPDALAVGLRQMQSLAHRFQHALGIGMGARLQPQHREAQRLQSVCTSGGVGGQHQIGLECDDAFDVGVDPAAHARQVFDGFRPIGIAVHPHQALTRAQRAHAFGQGGQQAHDALRRLRDPDFLLTIVLHRHRQGPRTPPPQGHAQCQRLDPSPSLACAWPAGGVQGLLHDVAARRITHAGPPIG